MRRSSSRLAALSSTFFVAAHAFAAPPAPGGPAELSGVAKPAEEDKAAAKPQTESEKLKKRRESRASAPANTCASCHRSLPEARLRIPAEQYATSVHKDARIGCVGCHRGDPEDPTVRAHAVEGFVPRPSHDSGIDVCGKCHADARFVRELNPRLGVDQATLYELSLHAKLARSGDKNAPSCATCHGTHDIARAGSATAPVNRRNVDRLCGKCHADRELMKPYEIKTDQVAKWQRGEHAKAFIAGDPNAPTCTGCHGAHAGAAAAASTTHVCGTCHSEQLERVSQSPHAKPFEQLGLSECMPCHDKHDVVATSWIAGMSPDSACSRCHARDEKVRRTAEEIATILRDVRTRGDAARAALEDARRAGLLVPGAGEALDELSTQELKLRVTVHGVDRNQLEVVATAARTAADRATALANEARADRRLERRGYYVALGLSLMLLGLLSAKAVQLDRRRRRSAA